MYQLSTTVFKSYYTEIKEIRVNTDKNLIFDNLEEIRSYKFATTRESADHRTSHQFPGTFSQMLFITSGNTQIYYRTYRKLFDVISQIGGFSNGIIFFANILLYFYSKNIILWHCISSVISDNEIKDKLDKNINIKVSEIMINPIVLDDKSKSKKKTIEERVKKDNYVKENSEENDKKDELNIIQEENSRSNLDKKKRKNSEIEEIIRKNNNDSPNNARQ